MARLPKVALRFAYLAVLPVGHIIAIISCSLCDLSGLDDRVVVLKRCIVAGCSGRTRSEPCSPLHALTLPINDSSRDATFQSTLGMPVKGLIPKRRGRINVLDVLVYPADAP